MSHPVHHATPDASVAHDRRRSLLRRYLETRGLVGDYERPHAEARLRAADGTRLQGSHLPGPPGAPGAVLLLHGFAANRRKPAYARLADALADQVAVLALDLRGHGGSGGSCTLGDREAEDVRAGVGWLRGYGYRRVAVLGVSMGGTAALHAVWRGVAVDALATVSAPAQFQDPPRTAPLRRLHAVWSSPARRLALRSVLGVHLAGPDAWSGPPDPVAMARAIRVPYLAVHGDDDGYFPADAGARLAAASVGPAVSWQRPAGFGHAEDGLDAAMIAALARAMAAALDGRGFPAEPG
jgi:pimeloyl-ACP methyl ester carboxylesterase